MERSVVKEFHYITPVANLTSIAAGGILSHSLATKLAHTSVASETIQDRRVGKRVPTRLLLHEYVNLYFDARNSMMFYLKSNSSEPIVVLQVSQDVLDIPGAVITDGNAACNTTQFYISPDGLKHLDQDRVYATWWTDPDPFIKAENKRKRSAEVLIPERIPVDYIEGFFAKTTNDLDACPATGIMGEVNGYVFFH